GLTLSETSEPIECQGHAISHWVAKKEDGTEAARGVNTFQFTPDGLIGRVFGFWMSKPSL
ncbi:MAG TPA: hypothetical protein VLH08_19100, partial [Acidobacteriota bacterium]|nr:hypothetical protein [Acidobacteriota bacterium]